MISVWFLFLSFIPLAMFVYFGLRAAWIATKMADDINLHVPLKDNVSYVGPALVFVWRKHEKVFPNQTDVRSSYRHYGIRAIAWFCVTILTLFALALVTQ